MQFNKIGLNNFDVERKNNLFPIGRIRKSYGKMFFSARNVLELLSVDDLERILFFMKEQESKNL